MAKKSNTRKIREYQEAAIKAMLSVPEGESGQVILPTGSGKTVIGEEFIKRKAEASKEKTVSAVFVPRLLLGKQWIRRSAINLLQQSRMPFAFVNINSGGGGGVRGRGAFMFAANVAVGNPHVADGPRGYTSPPKGHHSIFGKAGHSQVQNNEWIIFDSGQNTLAYLVEYDTKNPRY